MNKKTIIILLICLVYNFYMNTFYRPYIYSNKINDFGIADIGNNISFIPGVYFLLYLFRKKYLFGKITDIVFHFCFLSIVEILSAFIPHIGTFDIKDIIGLFIGALVLYFFIKNEN